MKCKPGHIRSFSDRHTHTPAAMPSGPKQHSICCPGTPQHARWGFSAPVIHQWEAALAAKPQLAFSQNRGFFSSIHRKKNTEMLMRISLKVKDVNLVTVFGTTCPKTLLCTLNAYTTAFMPRQSLYHYPIRHGMTWFIQQLWRHAIYCCWMCQKHKENDSKHNHSIILLFTVWTISGL